MIQKYEIVVTNRDPETRELVNTRHVVEVTIDVEKIAYIHGARAVKNKSGKARALNGLVLVREIKQ